MVWRYIEFKRSKEGLNGDYGGLEGIKKEDGRQKLLGTNVQPLKMDRVIKVGESSFHPRLGLHRTMLRSKGNGKDTRSIKRSRLWQPWSIG